MYKYIYIYTYMHIKTYHYTTDCRREALLASCSPQNAVTAITAKIKIVWRMSSPRSNLRRQKRYWSGGAAANILETHHVYLPEGQIRRDWRATLQMPTPVGKTMGPSLWSKLDDGWPESEKHVLQAALSMVVVKNSRWMVGEFYMSYGGIGCEK